MRKTIEKPSPNLPEIRPKLTKNWEKSKKSVPENQDGVRCVQKDPKMRKKCEKWPNIAPRPTQKEHTQKCCRSPLGPVWPLLGIYQALQSLRIPSNHAGGSPRTPAHCDASRSSAGVLFRDCAPAFFQVRHRSSRFPPQFVQNPSQIWSKSSQDLPKSARNPPKSFAKSTQNRPEAFLEPILD